MSLYDVLEVEPTAPPDKVKLAYRKKAAKAHPDKGGSEEEMRKVNHAYAIISSPEMRKRYDETGDTGEKQAAGDESVGALMAMFAAMFDAHGPEVDVVKKCRGQIRENINSFKRKIVEIRQQIPKFEKGLKKLKFKGEGPNILSDILTGRIAGLKGAIADFEHHGEVSARMLVLLENYEF